MKDIKVNVNGVRNKMKLRNTTIAVGLGAVTAFSFSLLQINKELIVVSTTLVVGVGLIFAMRNKNGTKKKISNYEYFFNRAQDKFEVAKYEEAILDYNKALEQLSPTEICLVYSMRGNAKRNLGDLDGAIDDQNKALNFDPLYADGYFNRGSAKYEMGDLEGAINDYTQVIKISPQDTDAFFNRANIKKEIGNIKSACEDWKQGSDLGDEEARKLLEENCE